MPHISGDATTLFEHIEFNGLGTIILTVGETVTEPDPDIMIWVFIVEIVILDMLFTLDNSTIFVIIGAVELIILALDESNLIPFVNDELTLTAVVLIELNLIELVRVETDVTLFVTELANLELVIKVLTDNVILFWDDTKVIFVTSGEV